MILNRTINIIVISDQVENIPMAQSIGQLRHPMDDGNTHLNLRPQIHTILCLNNMYEEVEESYTEEVEVETTERVVVGSQPVYVTKTQTIEGQEVEVQVIDHYEPIYSDRAVMTTETVTKTRTVTRHIDWVLSDEIRNCFDEVTEIIEPMTTITDKYLYSLQSASNPLKLSDYVWFVNPTDTLNREAVVAMLNNLSYQVDYDSFYFSKYNLIATRTYSEINSCTSKAVDPFNAICEDSNIADKFWEYIINVGLCKSFLFESPKINMFDETPIIMQAMQSQVSSSRFWLESDDPIYNLNENVESDEELWSHESSYYSDPINAIAKWARDYYNGRIRYLNEFIFKFMKSRLSYILEHISNATTRVEIINNTKSVCDTITPVVSGEDFFVSLTRELVS